MPRKAEGLLKSPHRSLYGARTRTRTRPYPGQVADPQNHWDARRKRGAPR